MFEGFDSTNFLSLEVAPLFFPGGDCRRGSPQLAGFAGRDLQRGGRGCLGVAAMSELGWTYGRIFDFGLGGRTENVHELALSSASRNNVS